MRKRFANKSKYRFRLIIAEEYQPVESLRQRTIFATWLIILLFFALQVGINLQYPPLKVNEIDLPHAPKNEVLTALALGDKVTFSKLLTLWLQAFDNQGGQSISFHDLDYDKVVGWLRSILELDPRTQYPMMNATRIYTAINDKEKIRKMVNFVGEEFVKDPASRWEWMAAAATLAKNELDDLELALELARELRNKTEDIESIPNWAKQMETFLLLDLNRFDEAALFLENLIDSGEVTDPNEFNLHIDRLYNLLTSMLENNEVESIELHEKRFEKIEALISKFQERATA